jgi:hypothetical protein
MTNKAIDGNNEQMAKTMSTIMWYNYLIWIHISISYIDIWIF